MLIMLSFLVSVLNFKMLGVLIIFHVAYFISKIYTKFYLSAAKVEQELDPHQHVPINQNSPYGHYSQHYGPLYSHSFHRHKSDQALLHGRPQNLFEPAQFDEQKYLS